jgi:hypothetical protein
MWILIIGLIAIAVVALVAGYLREKSIERKIDRGEMESYPDVKQADAECCGQHEVCEKESLLAAVSKEIEYYDDEELDRYKGRESDSYTDAEVEEFRDVLYTTREDEVAGWARSLQLRGINLPDALKDELFLIIGERREPGNNIQQNQ